MTIWAIKNPDEQSHIDFVATSLQQGISRFGWSYIYRCDLHDLEDMSWEEMDDDQEECYRKANFLLQVKPEDWVVHINVPSYSRCMAAQVVRGYSFDSVPNAVDDFRHTLGIDPATLIEFDRNDPNVLPIISSRLKLRRSHWRIFYPNEFERSLQNLRANAITPKLGERLNTPHLQNELAPFLRKFTDKIQENNPGVQFEAFLAEIFRRVPGVTDVREHGRLRGYGTDNGADLIVSYQTGLPLAQLQKPATLVVQAKSYTDQHWETDGVNQLKHAMQTFKADAGIFITTAEVSPQLLEAVEKLSEEMLEQGKIVTMLSGIEVARFALKFAPSLLFREE
jgi:hypothetical protein